MNGKSSAVRGVGASRIALEPRLTSQEAAEFTQTVQRLRDAPLDMDASQVVEIGTPCLQILLAAAESWRNDHLAFAVVEPSANFLAVLGHLGLDIESLRSAGDAA